MTKRIDAHFVAAGKYHDIDFARLEVLKLLAEHPEIRTTVAMDFSNTERLEQCQFLVTYTCTVLPTPEETVKIKEFLDRGGRWLALHGTNSILKFVEGGVDCPEERDDVMEVLGTQFKAHPPIGPFRVEVVDKTHPLTQGLERFRCDRRALHHEGKGADQGADADALQWRGDRLHRSELRQCRRAGSVFARSRQGRGALQHPRPLPQPLRCY
jgi:hypothetical protein